MGEKGYVCCLDAAIWGLGMAFSTLSAAVYEDFKTTPEGTWYRIEHNLIFAGNIILATLMVVASCYRSKVVISFAFFSFVWAGTYFYSAVTYGHHWKQGVEGYSFIFIVVKSSYATMFL